MVVLSGQPVAEKIYSKILSEMQNLVVEGHNPPSLAVIIVGENPASQVYVGHKQKMCHKLGYKSEVISLPTDCSEALLLEKIKQLNQNPQVDAILLQLPLPKHLDEKKALEVISENKDADCLTSANLGKLLTQSSDVKPCTPSGILQLLDFYNIDCTKKNVAVFGRSQIVGLPLSLMLIEKNATVTVIHSKSNVDQVDLKSFDLVFLAIGKAEYFKREQFKNDAVIIDIGIHRLASGRLCGDLLTDLEPGTSNNFQNQKITPVPGGIGPLTIAMLMMNTLKLAKINREINL